MTDQAVVGRLTLGWAEEMTDRRNGELARVDFPPWGRVCSLALGDSRDGESEGGGKGGLVQSMQPGRWPPPPACSQEVAAGSPPNSQLASGWDVHGIPVPSALPFMKA